MAPLNSRNIDGNCWLWLFHFEHFIIRHSYVGHIHTRIWTHKLSFLPSVLWQPALCVLCTLTVRENPFFLSLMSMSHRVSGFMYLITLKNSNIVKISYIDWSIHMLSCPFLTYCIALGHGAIHKFFPIPKDVYSTMRQPTHVQCPRKGQHSVVPQWPTIRKISISLLYIMSPCHL